MRKYIQRIEYSVDEIKISLYYAENLAASKNPPPSFGVKQSELELMVTAGKESLQIFPIILPNTIHKCKKFL